MTKICAKVFIEKNTLTSLGTSFISVFDMPNLIDFKYSRASSCFMPCTFAPVKTYASGVTSTQNLFDQASRPDMEQYLSPNMDLKSNLQSWKN